MRAGEPEFDRAVEAATEILRGIARDSRDETDALITYRQLSELLAQQDLQVPYHGGPMPYILEEASKREDAENRGMISALVVKQGPDGKPTEPSRGFHRMARRRPFNRSGDDFSIWWSEVRRLRAENATGESETRSAAAHGSTARNLVTSDNLGAWLVKCNPEVWDLVSFLADGGETITSWSVVPNYRAGLIRPGQRILFWVTGKEGAYLEPGLWGSGVIVGPVYEAKADGDTGYWLDEDQQQRTRHFAPMDVQLITSPVPRHVLKADSRLSGMEVFRQPQMGNPLFVTKEELAALDEHLPPQPVKVTVTASGAGFGNPVTNAQVEAAAMEAVTRDYEGRGWVVKDVSKDNLGWDLTCTSPDGDVEKIEVKGVSGLRPAILLTPNEERAARVESGWRLAVVTKALTDPELLIVDAETARSSCRPFMFKVDLQGVPGA
ncbi:protein NO VEIN domain-containing protein [Micromonospora sp. NPDC047670]|uniref:protein NO VEIN domain-containing protein n=1 Tax=Micromonospora sp. NPDC047670 TaxID=3364252 RepID=UPI00372257DD